MTLGTTKVVWLETQGSVWEVTQVQSEGQKSIPFGLFKYLLHSPFLSHRDMNASWSFGVRVSLGLEAVGTGYKLARACYKGYLQHWDCCLCHWSLHVLKDSVAFPDPPASNCLCCFLTPTWSSKLWRSLALEGEVIGSVGAEWELPFTVGFGWVLAALSASSRGERQERGG